VRPRRRRGAAASPGAAAAAARRRLRRARRLLTQQLLLQCRVPPRLAAHHRSPLPRNQPVPGLGPWGLGPWAWAGPSQQLLLAGALSFPVTAGSFLAAALGGVVVVEQRALQRAALPGLQGGGDSRGGWAGAGARALP
jgi:hypothetical protein